MNSTERVKELLKERGIPYARIERECGFGNGYLATKKGDLSAERLKKIADYLDVSFEYLMTGEEPDKYYEDEETVQIAQAIKDNAELKGLFSAARDASAETLQTIHQMLLIMKRQERHED